MLTDASYLYDATDVAAASKKHGFQVFEGLDLSKAAMDSTIRAFAVALSAADVGVFFYAGHGCRYPARISLCRSMPS